MRAINFSRETNIGSTMGDSFITGESHILHLWWATNPPNGKSVAGLHIDLFGMMCRRGHFISSFVQHSTVRNGLSTVCGKKRCAEGTHSDTTKYVQNFIKPYIIAKIQSYKLDCQVNRCIEKSGTYLYKFPGCNKRTNVLI